MPSIPKVKVFPGGPHLRAHHGARAALALTGQSRERARSSAAHAPSPPAQVHAREVGIRAVVFNSRGTSGSPVVTAQFYSASFTEDMR